MMSQIRILTDHVANQIAAGEVIERPAAVVKELVENSLDAGADRIEVEFRKGGKSYIRVEDNGQGMSRDDALLSIERHATSKIREARDLLRVSSFGFRGEALPSIASVSRFFLRSRPHRGSSEGSELLVSQGRLDRCQSVGMPPGTRIEVSHLFGSVPARRKFLKTDRTEASHIIHLVRLYAVAHPRISFTMIEDGREIFRSPACPSTRERIGELWGKGILRDLLEIERKEDPLHLYGCIGGPGLHRSTRHDLVTVVNGRPVQSRLMSYATIEAFHTFIPKGRYPVAFLFLEIPPDTVDVNIHPSKREVKFRNESDLRYQLIDAIQERLQGNPKPEQANRPSLHSIVGSRKEGKSIASKTVAPCSDEEPAAEAPPPEPTPTHVSPVNSPSSPPEASSTPFSDPKKAEFPFTFLGRLATNTAVFRSESGLTVMHCRAADERIRFEEMEGCLSRGETPVQQLLLPLPFEVDSIRSGVIRQSSEFLLKNGFVLHEFGRDFYRIEAIPAWIDPGLAEGFLRDLVDELKEGRISERENRSAHAKMAVLAAAQAWRKGDRLTDEQMVQMARRLLQCRNPLSCPAGKPTLVEWDHTDLERRFGRTIDTEPGIA